MSKWLDTSVGSQIVWLFICWWGLLFVFVNYTWVSGCQHASYRLYLRKFLLPGGNLCDGTVQKWNTRFVLTECILVFLQLESYWTYEVCHGRYVRQYHEDREVSKTKTQEFFLGRWNKEEQEKLSEYRQGPSTTAVYILLPPSPSHQLTLPSAKQIHSIKQKTTKSYCFDENFLFLLLKPIQFWNQLNYCSLMENFYPSKKSLNIMNLVKPSYSTLLDFTKNLRRHYGQISSF